MNFVNNFWTVEKLTSRIEEIGRKRYQVLHQIKNFESAEDELGENGVYPDQVLFNSRVPINHIWQGLDKYLWLKTSFELPSASNGFRVVGLFDFGTTEGGNNAGFEGLAFINNTIIQGIDSNHIELFFTEAQEGEYLELSFRLWSGLPGDSKKTEMQHQLKQADICLLDKTIDEFYYQSRSLLQIINVLGENDYNRVKLIKILNAAYLMIDWSSDKQKELESIYKASEYLENEVKKIRTDSEITVSAFGHAHVDVAWLWRLKHTREKIARTFSSVLKLMDDYEDYYFLQSMPQLYDYIKNDYPEIYAKIKEKVKEGKWEVEGGMWVEADCNIPSGESLVRQILIGQAFYKEEFDYRSKTLWLPDVFGYSWALPQILKLSNIDTFMTTKLGWNEYNSLPSDTFTWRGIDGSDILTHIITTPDDFDQPGFTYNSQMTAEAVVGTWNNYHEKSLNQDLLFAFGYGDGGGGPNREMLEMKKGLNGVSGFPTIKSTKVSDYFEKLKETVTTTDQYHHVWNGELYFEFHRGTYTSQAINKKLNRQFELKLKKDEMQNVIVSVEKQGNISNNRMNALWKILLRNQFHDIIPGSSIKEVYEDSLLEYQELGLEINKVESEMQSKLITKNTNSITFFNPSQWNNEKIVKVNDLNDKSFYYSGRKLETQAINDSEQLIYLNEVSPLSFINLEVKDGVMIENNSNLIEDKTFETNFYKVQLNEAGQIVSLYDKEAKRFVNRHDEKLNVFQVFTDKPIQFDAWNIDSFYQEKHDVVEDLLKIEKINGDIRETIYLEWNYKNSTIKQSIHFYKKLKRIDFETTVDWQEPSKLLKVAFPVDIHATEATYDIQYGNVKRPNHWNTSWDFAKFETVAHQWVDISERGYGVALLNDCKYGHDIKDNNMRLTLIKSAEYPDETQDIGQHKFIYSLLPHLGDFIDAGIVTQADDLNNPIQAVAGKSISTVSLIKIQTDHVMVDALKVAEDGDGFILRIHEFGGKTETIDFSSDYIIKKITCTNLMEEDINEPTLTLLGNQVNVKVSPYEIKTFRIFLENK